MNYLHGKMGNPIPHGNLTNTLLPNSNILLILLPIDPNDIPITKTRNKKLFSQRIEHQNRTGQKDNIAQIQKPQCFGLKDFLEWWKVYNSQLT